MKNLAIIPARKGSKGVKDKNIKLLKGKPLMAHTIQAAIDSEMFDRIIVSTDSEYYASIARKYGADVPFLRDTANSSDNASSWDVVKEVLSKLKNVGQTFDSFALLQPTSPLRDGSDIKEAYKVLKQEHAESIVSVCEMEHSPLWSNVLPQNYSLSHFIRQEGEKKRQDLEKYYRLNGAIYIATVNSFLEKNTVYGEKSFAYVMETSKSVDIDTELDFIIAEAIMDTLS